MSLMYNSTALISQRSMVNLNNSLCVCVCVRDSFLIPGALTVRYEFEGPGGGYQWDVSMCWWSRILSSLERHETTSVSRPAGEPLSHSPLRIREREGDKKKYN